MNKRQKLLYSFAKWSYKYNKTYFNTKKTFKRSYRFIKLNYRYIGDEEIKSILSSRRENCLHIIENEVNK